VIWMASLRRSPNFSSLNTLFFVYICCFPIHCSMRRTPYKKMFFSALSFFNEYKISLKEEFGKACWHPFIFFLTVSHKKFPAPINCIGLK
jgi:hypothetical protein